MSNWYDKLSQEVRYAKTTAIPRDMLYQAYRKILMAYELEAITQEEFFRLNTDCVRNGINNPTYFH